MNDSDRTKANSWSTRIPNGFVHGILLLAAVMLSASISGAQVVSRPEIIAEMPEILILNSYHDGYVWSESVMKGIRRVFGAEFESVEISVEHMDTKRFSSAAYYQVLFKFYRQKFENHKFDIVVVSDNNALNFSLDHRESLFPGVPIVFCGINGFRSDMLRGQTNITGVAEEADISGTIDIALKLRPKTRRIVGIVGETATARRLRPELVNALERHAKEYPYDVWSGLTFEDLISRVRSLGDDTIIFHSGLSVTEKGRVIEAAEAVGMVAHAASAPVFTAWDFGVVEGVVGGRVVSGEAQGEIAATLATRVLRGESPDVIPVVVKSANRFMFDALALDRFGISRDRLPPDSLVINLQESLFERYRRYTWIALGMLAALSLLIMILLLNIVRRHRVEAVLREREEQLRAILDNSPGTVVLKDLEGRFLMANAAYLRRFGRTMDELSQQTVDAVVSPEIAARIKATDAEVLETGTPREFEIVTPNADGGPSPQLVVIFPVRGEDGRIVGTGSFGLDITERKQAEERAQKLQSDLTDLMRHALLGEMATGMAHELNQPLAAIANYAAGTRRRIAEEPVSSEVVRSTLATITDQAMRAGDAIRRIRRFLGSRESDRRSIDINETVESTVEFHRRDQSEDGPSVETRLARGLPLVAADVVQVRQVLLGLLQNAVDAQAVVDGDSQPIIVATESAGPGVVAVSVRDWGEGIPVSARERIFEPFFTTKEGGFGMGLNVCQRIVEQHDGKLTVEPAEGGGTLARFTIKAASD